ncbi:uncharacterized protein LOC122505396 isoform X2 [Leptopilina heterotoma]|uniref:uncharacterized protein LOC122505396 isoform X2 n=1 Tax=Leptopilina heterotoma TaxID=63436 RepID=UPI001CA835F7|nr:uncharacterized protein LOC122505396 isoform X2 [Leptopilina heterotoma]
MGKVAKSFIEESTYKLPIKMSRSGRQIKLPQKISSDEAPLVIKKPKQSLTVDGKLYQKDQLKTLEMSSTSQSLIDDSGSNPQFLIPKDPLNIPMKNYTADNKSNSELMEKQNSFKNASRPFISPPHEHAEMFDFVDLELFQRSSEKINDASFKTRVLDILDVLREQNKMILRQQEIILKELSKNNNATERKLSESLLTPLRGFPIETVERFQEFESEIGKESRTRVYNHLVNMGGATLRNFLSNSLRRLLTDNLVCSFTWNGGDNTLKFGDTRIANVLYQASKRCENFDGPTNKEIFKHHMLEVLRHTKQRHRKLLKKNLPMETSEDHDEVIKLQMETLETERECENDDGNESYDCEEEIYEVKESAFLDT